MTLAVDGRMHAAMFVVCSHPNKGNRDAGAAGRLR
jgi:hypothetical protein